MPVDLFEKANIALEPSQPQGQGVLGKAADIAQRYVIDPVEKARLPEIAGGLLQGTYNVGRSLGNLPIEAFSKVAGDIPKIPAANLQQYTRQDPLSRAAFAGGEIAGSAMPAAGTFKAIEGATGAGNLLQRALSGAATGFATGEQPDMEGGRAIGAALGAVTPVATSALAKSLSKRLVNAKQAAQGRYSNIYDDIFNKLEKANLHDEQLKVPKLLQDKKQGSELARLKTAAPREYTRALDKFSQNPTFENAHEAQSDLGKMWRYLDSQRANRLNRGQEISSTKRNASELAQNLQKRLRGSMQNFLMENDRPGLLQQYSAATEGYKREVVPYLNAAIHKHQKGKLSAKQLMDSLTKDENFMNSIAAQNLSGLGLRKAASSTPAKVGAGLVAAPLLYEFGLPAAGRFLEKAQEAAR